MHLKLFSDTYSVVDIYKNKPQMTLVEIVAIVVGCIVAVAVLCCILGTVLECAAHVYKYWCPACVHEICGGRRPNAGAAGYHHHQTTTHVTSSANGGRNPATEPIVLFVKAIPPNYSTVSVPSNDQRMLGVGSCRTSPSFAQASTPEGDEDEDYDPSTRQFNHAAVYGRQFYQGARGRQFYLSNRGRRHSGHVVRTGYSRPISSRGFDHVILPNRDYNHHHQHQVGATRRDSEGGRETGERCTCDYGVGGLVSVGVRSGSGMLGPDCGAGYPLPHHSSRDLERVLISGEYVAYRLIRTRPTELTAADAAPCHRCGLGCSQTNIDFLRPADSSSSCSSSVIGGGTDHYSSILHQPDIVSDIGSSGGGSFVATSATYGVSQTFAICDERHAVRSSALNLLSHRCFRDVKPPPSYASITRK